MGTKMTHTARAELTSVVRRRYSVATGAQKRKILDEFIAVTGYHEEPGTDLHAIAEGHIAVTPLHFDLLDVDGMDELSRRDLARLLEPAAREVE